MNIWAKIFGVVAAAAIVATSAAAFAPAAQAQDPGATPAAEQELRTAFLERVAGLLGIDLARLEQAIRDAQLQIVDEALATGRIDDAQAAKARERIESGRGLGLGRIKQRIKEHRRHARMLKVRGWLVEQAADAIGVTPEELKGELKAGKSVAEVAEANGTTADAVKQSILDAAAAKLDEAVANGRIDQAAADDRLAQLSERLDGLLQRKRE